MSVKDSHEYIKLKPEILRILVELSSTAQDERNTTRFESLRKLTNLIHEVYASIKINGSDVDNLNRINKEQLEEIAELHKQISKQEYDLKTVQEKLDKSLLLIRKILSEEPSLNNRIPNYEISEVLGEKKITNFAVKKYLKIQKVA